MTGALARARAIGDNARVKLRGAWWWLVSGGAGVACGALVACGSAAGGSGVDPGDGAAGSGGGDPGAGGSATAGAAGQPGAGGFGAIGGAAGSPPVNGCADVQKTAEVYAHSPDTLYKLDPGTKATTTVAKFSGCKDQVIDLAVDKAGRVFVTTFTSLERVDPVTAKCTTLKTGLTGTFPNSLSFVPAGTISPSDETLVGYQAALDGDAYVRVDTTTGAVSPVPGGGGLPAGYQSSGDIVSVIGGGTYLTIKGGGGAYGTCADCLVEVDPKTGNVLKKVATLKFGSVFGLAFWAGITYGFTSSGQLFSVDLKTVTATEISIPQKPSGLKFWGAGSTTCAPPVEPE
ncbi:MAG: hypothetical protein IT374_00400 [Polyangiaceae bacterium]|nr:hypothetical protein [Polyangiaceae bacterium]